MAARKKDVSVVALEIERYESKIKEFQDYLEYNNILTISWDKEGDKHKEIETQKKLMDALPNWIQGLKQLKQTEEDSKAIEVRGDQEIPAMMKKRLNGNTE